MRSSALGPSGAGKAGRPALVLCAHGTRDPAGALVSSAVADAVAAALPDADVRLGFADVQQPAIGELVATLAPAPVVVVPLLLSFGYHVETDIAAAVSGHPAAVASAPVGPHPRLTAVLGERLAAAGVPPDQPVVLGAAGSTRPRALADVVTARDQLAASRPGPVHLGFAAAASPSVSEAVSALRAAGQARIAVAAYLLAPGSFLRTLGSSGADLVTEPIGPAPQLVDVVAERYAEGARLLHRA